MADGWDGESDPEESTTDGEDAATESVTPKEVESWERGDSYGDWTTSTQSPSGFPIGVSRSSLDFKGTHWPGLTPPASEMRQLSDLDPALARETLELHRENVRHAHQLDVREQEHTHSENREWRKGDQHAVKRGAWMAFALAVFVILVAGYLGHIGETWPSTGIGTIGFATLVYSFLRAPHRDKSKSEHTKSSA